MLPVSQSNFTQGPVGSEYCTYSWLPLAIGPLTRNCILGNQLQTSKLPLYELTVNAVIWSVSLASVGWSCAVAVLARRRKSTKAQIRRSLLFKGNLLIVRADFWAKARKVSHAAAQ